MDTIRREFLCLPVYFQMRDLPKTPWSTTAAKDGKFAHGQSGTSTALYSLPSRVYFAPWLIEESRRELKRYGVLFTCLSSRAIHLEVSAILETDSFINALRRFINRRGPVRTIRCDQGNNLVRAKNELQLSSMDQTRVRHFLFERNCDRIEF